MDRKHVIAGLGIMLVPGLLQAANKKVKETHKEKKMNVLFILSDDLRPTLGCYSDPYAITPNMDAIASRGVVFHNAYCQQAVSNPSRASMLTGLRPDQTGVTDLFTNFRIENPRTVTLPQLFKDNGYYTAGTGKVFHTLKGDFDSVSWTEFIPLERRGYLLPGSLPPKGGKGVSYEAADVRGRGNHRQCRATDQKSGEIIRPFLPRNRVDQTAPALQCSEKILGYVPGYGIRHHPQGASGRKSRNSFS